MSERGGARKNPSVNFMKLRNALYIICACCTSMVGYHIHGSFFWAIVDWPFWPFAWVKWLIMHEVNLSIIKATFEFFAQ